MIVGASSSSISLAQGFAGGTGTKINPYIISNAAELIYFAQNYNNKTDYYKITNDIDLGDIDWTDYPTGTFKGHLIGEKPDGTKPVISNYTITVPTTLGNYGLLGYVSGGEIRNIGVSTVTINYAASQPQYQKGGALIGNAEAGSLVEGCSADGVTLNVEKQTIEIHCGGLIGRVGGSNTIVRNCSMKNYTLNFTGSITNGNYAALAGSMEGLCTMEDCSIETIKFDTSNALQGCNLSGIAAKMKGSNATNRSVIRRCSVKDIVYDLRGEMQIKVGIGSITSWVNGNSDITQCKTTGLRVELSGDITATGDNDIRLGGMVAKLENGCNVTDCLLYGTNFIGAKSGISKNFTRPIAMNVGGVVGSTVTQDNTSGKQIVIERCVAYCDFDFSGYTSKTSGNFSTNGFVIGGVVGRLFKPYYIPTTLYYSGKIKAPYSVVGPLVGTFQSNRSSAAFIYDDYSGVNDNSSSKDADYNKWYYGDYQLWLTSSVINSGKTRNGNYSAEGYATIGDVSGWTENSIGGTGKKSKTILPYTQSLAYSASNLNIDKAICPNYNENNSNFPDYYMYYAQGVNRGSYQNNINTVLTALRNGDNDPVWDVVNGKIVMYLFRASEKMKAGDALKSELIVECVGASAFPDGYTGTWKIGETSVADPDDVARILTPQTATVYISKGGTTIETHTVTIPRAEWYQVGAMATAPTGAGTAANPYKIATASDLAWMGHHVSLTDAKNTEHYELTADIDLGAAWWSPMNGMEETGNGSFAGVFDGQTHTISNLHIDWDTNYASAANFGLFSIIEGISNSQWAVVRNLVIDNAVVSKETNASISGNRCVGILAGNIKPYSQIENVIVRSSEIRASAIASAQNGKVILFGGLAGKINNDNNNYRFLNISTDVNFDLSKLTVNNSGNVVVGGVIGQWKANAKTCVTNVYALGSITVPSGPTNVGSVFGQNGTALSNDAKATVFYVNAANNNVGTQKSLVEYAISFLETANDAVGAHDDLYPWAYSPTKGYSLSIIGLEVVDADAQQLRFAMHTLEIHGIRPDVNVADYTYRWLLNDEEVGTGTTYEVKPIIPGDNPSFIVEVSSLGELVANIPVPIPMGKFQGTGTSASDPYLVGCKEELQLLSYLSNQVGTYLYNGKTTTEYNQAYYILDDNVDMTGVTNFAPIGSVKDNYEAENCFRGHFDGKGNYISGISMEWLAGDVDAEVNRVWGLFGAIQGVSTSQKAVIQNLVIKDAVLTHKTSNTSFYYNNGTSGNANNCYVGVLAGLVGANTTIQNIELSGCSITDAGSSSYKIADKTLSIGGVVGRAQYSFSSEGDLNVSTVIRLISSDCDITIEHASFTTESAANEYKTNVAGIIGSMKSTGTSGTMPWPSCTYYTGQVKAIGKAMVSPVFSCAEFMSNTNYDYGHYCNLYVGRVISSDNPPVSDVFYGSGYQIYYDGGFKSITNEYPANTCEMGARTLVSHSSYAEYSYQGVNYGTYVNAANEADVVTAYNAGRTASNDPGILSFGFSFGADGKLHLGEVFAITFTDNHSGDASVLEHTLTIENNLDDTGLTYKWYINGEHTATTNQPTTLPLTVTPQLVYVKAYRGEELKYTTNVIELPRGYTFTADYAPKYEFTGTFTVTPDETFTDGEYTYAYEWEEATSTGRTPLSETSAVLTGADSETIYYCTVTATDTRWETFLANMETPAYSDVKAICGIIASKYSSTLTTQLTIKYIKATVVWLHPGDDTTYDAGSDDNDGKTNQTPVKTWQKAYSLLRETGTWDENIIVLMGTSSREATCDVNATHKGFSITKNIAGNNPPTESYTDWKTKVDASHLAKAATITGKYEGVDYHGVIEAYGYAGSKYLSIFGDTRFEHITFNHISTGGHSDYIFCQYNNLEMGEGVRMTGYNPGDTPGYCAIDGAKVISMQIYGGLNNDGRFRTEGGILDMALMEATMPHGKEGFSITLKSGRYSSICVGDRHAGNSNQYNGLMGTPNMPIKCTITIDIDRTFNDKPENNPENADYDCGIIQAGCQEGAMYADVDVVIKSGYVARVVNGTLGNQKNFNFKYPAGSGPTYYFPDNTYMGRANILIDPRDGDDSKVKVTELYGGSTGRGYMSNTNIDNPFYGYSTVTINGGTFTILPENNTKKAYIYSGIYGAGAGGYNGIGDDTHHTVDQRIAYWSDDKSVVLFGNYAAATAKEDNLVFAHCYNKDGSYTDVDPTLTNTKIIINGGVFGSSTEPIDGVYAGGSGYMSPSLFYSGSVTPSPSGGNVYGNTGETVSTLTINGGTFYCKNGIFAGGRGTDEFYSNKKIKGSSNSYRIGDSDHVNYDKLGQTYGNVELNINGGDIHCNVYGGGAGVAEAKLYNTTTYNPLDDMARLTGNSVINIGSKDDKHAHIYGNVYGGGMLAGVTGSTNVNISGNAVIEGSVFGAAQGITSDVTTTTIPGTSATYLLHTPDSAKLFGIVSGNATIKTSGNPTIHGDVYGGAESGITEGNTSITINGGTLGNGNNGGNVYGGGLGALNGSQDVIASANVNGNTYVKIDKANYASTSADYYIYGGGNLASDVGGKTEVIINDCSTTDQVTVYGGGYGSNTSANNAYVTINKFDTESNTQQPTPITQYGLSAVYGGGNAGPVHGKTNVALNGGQIFGDVFGGGNVASVGTEYPSTGSDEEKTQYLNTYASQYGTALSMYGVGPIVYGNIYGGGNKANVYGNTSVGVSNGTFAGEIFGGGKGEIDGGIVSADVIGATNVYVSGTTVVWNRKWNHADKTLVEWDGTWDGTNREVFMDGTELNPIFRNNHNIYGGGNVACRVLAFDGAANSGVAAVDVSKGFCGIDLLSTDVWQRTYSDNNNPHFSVFGGGYGAYTSVGSTNVRVSVADLPTLGGATTEQQLAKASQFEGQRSKVKGQRQKASRNGDSDKATIGVFDDSHGVPGLTVHSVIGGGYAGIVEGNTDVTVGGNTFMHRVFGGGYGQLEAYTELAPNAAIAEGKTRENLGEVGGNATVFADGGYIYGEIFGGGAGVESAKLNGSSTFTDFKDMGRVKGTTSVTIAGDTQVFGSVYGGGDVANVGDEENYTPDYTVAPQSASSFEGTETAYGTIYSIIGYTHSNAQSFVNIIGGDIFGEVFAGGNGRKRSEANDYTKLGRIEGNALVHVADTQHPTPNTPVIWNRIFGGCSYGTVDGNTLVHIEGGMLGYNIFGGGLGDAASDTPESQTTGSYANVKGNTNVTIDGGTWLWNQMADTQGNVIEWKGVSQTIANNLAELRAMSVAERMSIAMRYYDPKFIATDANGNPHFAIAHNIFGGGLDACRVGTLTSNPSTLTPNTGNATVIINHSPLGKITDAKGNVINMLDETTVGGLYWYACISNIANPQFSVFGGGYGMNTTVGSTNVFVQPGVRFRSSDASLMPVEEGGKTPYAYMTQDYMEYGAFEDALFLDFEQVTEEEKIKMYGSSDGSDTDPRTFLRYRASRLAMSLGAPSFTFMDIHGGGYSGYVMGDARVITDGQLACRNVFGGGLGSRPSEPDAAKDYTYGEVGGNAYVSLHSGIVSLNVFGGGAGVESYWNGTRYIDFPNIARVKGKTEVEVYGESVSMNSYKPNPDGDGYLMYDMERVMVFGSVYGGGDVACVGVEPDTPKPAAILTTDSDDFTTSVSIYGASIMSAAYAGGNGRVKAKCNDYTKLGAVYGNTRFYVENTTQAYPYNSNLSTLTSNPVVPYLWDRVYGGCQNGTVYGNTLVDLNGGYFLYNIFGGGWGDVDSLEVNGVRMADPDRITSADVKGNTNIYVRGAEAKVTSLWDPADRDWVEAKVINKNGEIKLYSPQYDPTMRKFTVNHNIYGGGRTACVVEGNTYVTMTKGMLHRDREVVSGVSTADIGGFFNTSEWSEIYHKVGSPHFSVFGGGYGENTVVQNNTYVNVSVQKEEMYIVDADTIRDKSQLHTHFYSCQSVMDVVGGGYSGRVRGATNVTIGGETFLRHVFGGGFYAPVGAANVKIKSIDCNGIFGGGLMGDVGFTDATMYNDTLTANAALRGVATLNVGTNAGNNGESVWIHNNIYGGNDVSGDILGKAVLNLSAGHVDGNVYGAGNGDYLYAVGRNKEKKVTLNEYYKMGKNTYDLVYTVPQRGFMTSIAASTPAQRMVNCSSYRPKVQNVVINLNGPSADYPLVLGGLFGGGNSATVNNITGAKPTVTFNFGSNLNIGNVFMGCDGDAMFDGSEKYRKAFEDLNTLHLEDEIDWSGNPGNHAITLQYLPVAHENRPKVYQHLLDLYFQSVEMDIQPVVNWSSDMTNVTIGSFFCGGNRGNMNVEPDAEGKIVDYSFPSSLVITDKIVGGCNKANYKMPNSGILHKGGYLLGVRGKNAINLTVNCQFKPTVNEADVKEGGNVYGGCYTSGTIDGDVYIDMKSDMLADVTPAELAASKASDVALGNVYGAGYGSLAYVRGNTRIDFGKDVAKNAYASSRFDNTPHGVTANYIYGGGHQGCLVGNSTVRVYNGHVFSSVCGASYSGLMWGSTHVLVGYPKYYTVQKSGTYSLQRTDKWNNMVKNSDNSEVVKKSIKLLEGDIISEEVFDAIWSYDTGHTQATTGTDGNFSAIVTTAPANWNDIDIRIDEAVYGGGYVLSSGSSVAAGTYTLKKYNDEENLDDYLTSEALAALGSDGSTKGYGGNTTLLVWDAPTNLAGSTDHISVSMQTMNEKAGLSDTDDIFGYYYQDTDGNYKYIYEEGKTITSTDAFFSNPVRRDGKIVVFEPNAEGGMYGDGRLSFAEGFRSGELYGYGFAAKTPEHARIVNSFQRMDMLRLTDCAVTLLGARDYNVSEISATPYSIARVGEIQMIAQNVTNLASGTLAATSVSRSRNYLGLSNNIHYCGAMFSNVAFTDAYHKSDRTVESGMTYLAKKQYYIDEYKDRPNEFRKRNEGTAANMIGIASGYALKVQNVKTVGSSEEEIFYGPAVGIFEVALVNVRDDEGGGYVYAKNIHTRSAGLSGSKVEGSEVGEGKDLAPSGSLPTGEGGGRGLSPRRRAISTDAAEVDGTEDFLQTSGNFVFAHDNAHDYRYIVDDCFSHGYDNQASLEEKDDIHYWYVTGAHYYYNTTITGYTYNSTSEPYLKFNSDNHDALMNLVGTTAGSQVKLKSVTWRSVHSDSGYSCDLEERNTDNESEAYQKYQLVIGATKATTYDGLYDYNGVTPDPATGAYYVDVPFKTTTGTEVGTFTGTTEIDAANIVLQLVDKADNSSTEYFNTHMAEPCLATIDLETTVGGTKYTYTIYLTINYVQGPDVTGTLKVENCALPGEMIEINKGSILVESDQSIAQCATIYRIGPRVKDEHGEWHFKKDADDKEIYYTYEVGYPYVAENGIANATSEMLAGVVYDESNTTNPCIRVPAYYFMNDYGVQYCFRVYGLNETFIVPMDDDSKITVHNYHRMEPRRSGGGIYEGDDALDLHIDLAAQRARDGELSEPRIYIEDAADLKRFASFINEKTDEAAAVGSKNSFGANMQFVMQDNVTIGSDYVAPDNFKGTFHGDGHAIMGLDKDKGLFKAIDATTANIYNLGLVSGKIVAGSASADNASLHCCYEYGQNTVYRMDGTAYKGYTKDDWRYGKVAYDLNEYYLNKRYVVGSGAASADAQDYVENYYANGDYLYAGYSYDNHFEGSEFIRNAYLPNYGYAATTHDVTHPIDESRAVVGEDGTVTYQAQFNDTFIEDGKPKNDYFFFGQILDADTKGSAEGIAGITIPTSIALDEESDAFNLNEAMSNRVYRAGGYYGSKNNNGFYYNSDVYVHNNGITAIDFFGYNGQSYTDGTGANYYYPVSDYGMGSIDVNAGVTRNLLLYARNATDRTSVLSEFNYIDADGEKPATPEYEIRAHIIDQAATPTTGLLHLVERTADDKDSEGGNCINNDFNCPIAFNVTNRAWYTRVPRYYAANKNDAWEGITLPFSVNKVEASFNGEISHFYGAADNHAANDATDANTTNAGHEYWLRGLTASTPAADAQPIKATFTRPGADLFADGTLTGNYSYFNSHFADVYGAIYGEGDMSIYNTAREFNGYYFQQAYIPYIVSFPGATFKEFDLSGEYNQALNLGDHSAWDADDDAHGFSFREEAMTPQSVTFSWYCVNNNVTNAKGAVSVGVTDDCATSTTAGTVTHNTAFSAQSNSDAYGIDAYGTAFDTYVTDVLPFRTYMTVTSSPAKALAKPKKILIYEGEGIEELPQEGDAEIDGLRIWSNNSKIYVESPVAMSLNLYTSTGQLVRIFDVVPGTNTYSGFANGIYIIGKKKLYVK